VREILGDENVSGISDDAIRDALWNLYFDVEQTVHWLIGMHWFGAFT
jgi:elongation factor 1 alpha-like protein